MNNWEKFQKEKLIELFTKNDEVIDIGGGLRVIKEKNNRYDPSREWLRSYIEKVNYKILDPVDTYNPDIIGDIQNLPFDDGSIDAITCLAVLEHVENPILSVQEMHRSLKKGGMLYVYVPFLFYYHAEKGYYGDFWRFTEDGLRWLFRDFDHLEIQGVRGAIETWIKLSPFGRIKFLTSTARFLDKITGKSKSKQVSGYNVFCIK